MQILTKMHNMYTNMYGSTIFNIFMQYIQKYLKYSRYSRCLNTHLPQAKILL